MIGNEVLNIAKNLSVALMRVGSDSLQTLTVFLIDRRGLRMQDKRNRQQPLDCSVSGLSEQAIEAYLDPLNLYACQTDINSAREKNGDPTS